MKHLGIWIYTFTAEAELARPILPDIKSHKLN